MVHEWALADAVIEYVSRAVDGSKPVKKLLIKIGKLQSIDLEILGFAMRELASGKGLAIGEIEFEETYPRLRCNRCGFEWVENIDNLNNDAREAIHFLPEAINVYVKCSKCGSRDFTIVSGRGVESIEILW